MEDFESILQQQQFEGGAATGVLDHEWVPFVHAPEKKRRMCECYT